MSGPGNPVKWVETQNLHLTLKFLGDINADSVESVLANMKEATAGTGNLRLEMSGLGTFPGGPRVRVIWTGLSGDVRKLSTLQERVETGLVLLGFKKETRAFQPHLTIGRVRDKASFSEREDLYRQVERHAATDAIRFSVDSLILVRSTLTRSGPVYTELGRVSL
jgi:2'-5' RNA ligase